MGSVPVNVPRLVLMSIFVEIFGIFFMLSVDFEYDWIALSVGVIFYLIMYGRYRNSDKRHTYEKETKNQISNVKTIDNYIERRKRLRNRTMKGANNKIIYGNRNKKTKINIKKN